MNKNENTKWPVCCCCLSFRDKRDADLNVTEDIRILLESLLYDFDIDAFFRSKPPDKTLELCRTCNNTFRDIIAFKELIQKSFNEFMKYWCVDTQLTTRHTATAPGSSQTANVAPIQVKNEESDPLEVNQLHTEYIDIHIKEETDISDVKEETNIIINEFNEPEPAATIQLKHETPTEYNNAGTPQTENYTNNENVFNHNVAPVSYNAVQHSNEFIINNVTATNTSRNSYFDNQNVAVPCSSTSNNFVKHIIVIPTNETIIQNTAIRVSNAATTSQNLNLTVGNNSFNVNSGVTANISTINNTANVTKSKSLRDLLLDVKERNSKRSNDGPVIMDNEQKIGNVVNIDGKGAVSIGGGIIKSVAESKKGKSTTQRPSTTKSEPNTNIDLTQTAEDDVGTPAPESSATESERRLTKPHMSSSQRARKKWYIKLVTRDEVLKKMEERRDDPEFLRAPYKCDLCVNVFVTEELAEIHKETRHSEESEFTCFACHSMFEDFNALNAHFYDHMADVCVYYCTTCEFETKHVEHMKYHKCANEGSKPLPPKDPKTMRLSRFKTCYYCPKCEFTSIRAVSVSKHYSNKHQTNPKVKCNECGKCYNNKLGLYAHVNWYHRGKKPAGMTEPMYCKLCDKWYAGKNCYNTHMKNKHSTRDLKFVCEECGKKFLTPRALLNHKKFHEFLKTGVKNHKCSDCGKEYYNKRTLRNHVRVKHEKKRSRDHICEICGMAFFTRYMLKYHGAKHSDERPLKCSYCEDTFKYSGALLKHTKLKHKKKKNSEDTPKTDKSKKDKEEKKQRMKKNKRVKRKRVERSSSDDESIGFAGLLNI